MVKSKRFAKIEIDESRCKGCGLCTIGCPRKLLELSDEIDDNGYGYPHAIITSEDKCVGCALCAGMCPDVAINVYSCQVNVFTGMHLLERHCQITKRTSSRFLDED